MVNPRDLAGERRRRRKMHRNIKGVWGRGGGSILDLYFKKKKSHLDSALTQELTGNLEFEQNLEKFSLFHLKSSLYSSPCG